MVEIFAEKLGAVLTEMIAVRTAADLSNYRSRCSRKVRGWKMLAEWG